MTDKRIIELFAAPVIGTVTGIIDTMYFKWYKSHNELIPAMLIMLISFLIVKRIADNYTFKLSIKAKFKIYSFSWRILMIYCLACFFNDMIESHNNLTGFASTALFIWLLVDIVIFCYWTVLLIKNRKNV